MASKDLGLVRPNVSAMRNFEYGGKNLIEIFGSISALSEAVVAGDFSEINVGDYVQVTLSGNFYDYAAGATKSINQVMTFEAMPDFYINTNGMERGTHHILFLSRDLLGQNLQMRSENTTWYDSSVTNPWLGSHLYQTFNNKSNGIRALMENTILAGHIYDPSGDGSGISQYAETKASGAASATSWANYKKGALFLPSECEVWGHPVFSEARVLGNASAQQSLQWPIFVGSHRHIQKSTTPGGSRAYWWVASSSAGSAGIFCLVGNEGMPNYNSAASTYIGAPVGFLFR